VSPCWWPGFRNWVPPTSMLYWRGPVFYDFDGQDWQLDPNWPKAMVASAWPGLAQGARLRTPWARLPRKLRTKCV
jgi:hypothetical protein